MPQTPKSTPSRTQTHPKKADNDLPQPTKSQTNKLQPTSQTTTKIHHQKIVLEDSDLSKTISSTPSAFWPFTKSFQQNNFLSHIISQDQQPLPQQDIQSTQSINFIPDPTSNLFTKLKKLEGDIQFSVDEIVLAKCVGEPLWPARITSVENVEGLLPDGKVYNLKFINERNTCMIDKTCLVRFNQYSMEELRKVVGNKKLLRAIKLAQKYSKEQLEDFSYKNHQKIQDITELKQTQIQLSLSSIESCNTSQNICNTIFKNIQKTNDGFLILKKDLTLKDQKQNAFLSDPVQGKQGPQIEKKPDSEVTKSNSTEQKQQTKMSIFKPIILFKGQIMEINLHKQNFQGEFLAKDKQSETKAGQQIFYSKQQAKTSNHLKLQENKNKETVQRDDNEEKDENGIIKISRSAAKPINLVLQTPKLNPSEYYLNKIIVKFNQTEQSLQNAQIKPLKSSDIDLDETVMEDSNSNQKTTYQQNHRELNITQQVRNINRNQNLPTLTKKFNTKYIQKLNAYLLDFISQSDAIGEMTQDKNKHDQILQLLSIPLPKVINRFNYLEYDKILKNSLLFIQKSRSLKTHELFLINLHHKLQSIWEFLSVYSGKDCFITTIKDKNVAIFTQFFKSEQKNIGFQLEKAGENFEKRIENCDRKQKVLQNLKNEAKVVQGTDDKIQKDQNKHKAGGFKVKLRKMMVISDEEDYGKQQETIPCFQTN